MTSTFPAAPDTHGDIATSGEVAEVLLGGYPAKQCPTRTHNDFHPDVPDPDPLPDAVLRRMAEGVVFEDEVTDLLVAALGQECVVIVYGDHRADKPRRIAETIAAMEAGVPVIVGGQLPDDHDGSRTGSPDVLIRASEAGRDATYLPADIKHHSTLKPGVRGQALVSGLGDGFTRTPVPGWSHMTSHRVGDAIQLAHYTRMLQAIGRHPGDHLLAGAILGTSDFTDLTGQRYGFVWYDLTALTEKTWGPDGSVKRSILECYDTEFARRVQIATDARTGAEPTVRPFGKAECAECPYLRWCTTQAGPDDASFAIRTGMVTDREWEYLHSHALGTIDALAATIPTGPLADGYVAAAVHLNTPERRFATLTRRARMHRDSILFERIGAAPAVVVPVADVEIDFDVEWHPSDGFVYQWGARVRHNSDEATATYAPTVVSFDPLDAHSAQALADRFFAWMETFVAEQEEAGRTVAIYHWTSPETTRATRALGGERAERLFAGRFLDLKRFMEDHYFARDGFSLKVVAPALGFHWQAPDAGGATSVVKIEEARAGVEPAASAAREWLLTYNEDDCAAQAAIRDGLHAYTHTAHIPG